MVARWACSLLDPRLFPIRFANIQGRLTAALVHREVANAWVHVAAAKVCCMLLHVVPEADIDMPHLELPRRHCLEQLLGALNGDADEGRAVAGLRAAAFGFRAFPRVPQEVPQVGSVGGDAHLHEILQNLRGLSVGRRGSQRTGASEHATHEFLELRPRIVEEGIRPIHRGLLFRSPLIVHQLRIHVQLIRAVGGHPSRLELLSSHALQNNVREEGPPAHVIFLAEPEVLLCDDEPGVCGVPWVDAIGQDVVLPS